MVGRQFNGGGALVWGAEVTAGWCFDLPRDLAIPAKVVYTDSRFTFNSDDPVFNPVFRGLDGLVLEGDRLPYVPMHSAQAQLGLAHRFFDIHLVGTYVGESLEGDLEGDRVVSEVRRHQSWNGDCFGNRRCHLRKKSVSSSTDSSDWPGRSGVCRT